MKNTFWRNIMKRVETDKLISKMMIITTALFTVMFGLWLVNTGYQTLNFAYYTMPGVMIAFNVLFVTAAILFVVLGFKKSPKYFEASEWFGALAVLTMLLKINYEIKSLQIAVNGYIVMFYPALLVLAVAIIIISWIYTICCILRK
jgi:hypothetical protein